MDLTLQILAKSLTLRSQRHSAISSNIANADTPGFRPSQVSFEQALQSAAAKKQGSALDSVDVKVSQIDDGVPRLDGNSVNLDRQMANLSENAILYNTTAEFVARKFRMLKSVIG